MTQKVGSQSDSFSDPETKMGTFGGKRDDDAASPADEIIDGARALGTEVKHMASDVADEAKKAAESKIGAGKDFAAEHLGSVAHALRKTGEELRESDSAITEYVDKAASSVERVSTYLQEKTLSQLLGDVEGYARREPAVFLGGAFFLGLLGGRFLKSAMPTREGARPSQAQVGGDGESYRALPQSTERDSAPSASASGARSTPEPSRSPASRAARARTTAASGPSPSRPAYVPSFTEQSQRGVTTGSSQGGSGRATPASESETASSPNASKSPGLS